MTLYETQNRRGWDFGSQEEKEEAAKMTEKEKPVK